MFFCFTFIIFAYNTFVVSGLLDIEELKNLKYGIKLLKVPVDASLILESLDILSVSSKYGQKYSCKLPNSGIENSKIKEEEKIAEELGIPDLLKPMEQGPCLVYTKDWWTYEFCYGRFVHQYHIEDGRPSGPILELGVYESEYDWKDDDSAKEKKERLNRYHSQQYVNGTVCDLNSKPRRVEVRFECEDGVGDHIASIVEPESCAYVLTVHTTKICHHPYLKPSNVKRVTIIICNPLLDSTQYQLYLNKKANAAANAAATAKRSLEYTQKSSQLPKFKNKASDSQETFSEFMTEFQELLQTKRMEAAANLKEVQMDKMLDHAERAEKTEETENPDGWDDPIVHSRQMEHLSTQEYVEGSNSASESSEHHTGSGLTDNSLDSGPGGTLTNNDNGETGGGSDNVQHDQALHNENVGIKKVGVHLTLSNRPDSQSTTAENTDAFKVGDKDKHVKNSVEKDLLDEFQKELKEMDMEKKDDMELEEMKSRIRKSMTDQFEDIIQNTENEMKINGNMKSNLQAKETLKHLTATLNELLRKLEKSNQDLEDAETKLKKTLQSVRDGENSRTTEDELEENDDTSDPVADDPSNSIVKVRLMKLKRSQKGLPNREGAESSSLEDSVEFNNLQKKQLESTVREELQKAGIDPDQKIHIKVVTSLPGGSGDNLVLDESDSAAFNRMIISVFGGNRDEVEEVKRQGDLESGYNFVWDDNAQSTSDNQDS